MKTTNKIKATNILIPNGTSSRNLGDKASLEVLIDLIKNNVKGVNIIIHSSDPHHYPRKIYKVDHTLYSWTIFSNTNALSRIIKIFELLIKYIELKFNIKYVPGFLYHQKLKVLINDYQNADEIIFVGGGYLRSKKGIVQSLNLLMFLIIFQFAKLFKAKKIVAPISFGPFAYKWQENLAAKVLKNLDLIAAREEYSHHLMKKHKIKNLILSSDHALLIDRPGKKKNRRQKLILGFTIRGWLSKDKQDYFENSFAEAIRKFSGVTGAAVQPIIQVDAPMYGEDDLSSTRKISKRLKKNNVETLKIKHSSDIRPVTSTYSTIDLLLGMRMHSNILAATQGTPFVAISYEHKTEGIAKQLGMDGYCVKCTDVNEKGLYQLLIKAFKNRESLQKRIINSITRIQNKERRRWASIIPSYIN